VATSLNSHIKQKHDKPVYDPDEAVEPEALEDDDDDDDDDGLPELEQAMMGAGGGPANANAAQGAAPGAPGVALPRVWDRGPAAELVENHVLERHRLAINIEHQFLSCLEHGHVLKGDWHNHVKKHYKHTGIKVSGDDVVGALRSLTERARLHSLARANLQAEIDGLIREHLTGLQTYRAPFPDTPVQGLLVTHGFRCAVEDCGFLSETTGGAATHQSQHQMVDMPEPEAVFLQHVEYHKERYVVRPVFSRHFPPATSDSPLLALSRPPPRSTFPTTSTTRPRPAPVPD